jgi:hypothetical protein
MLYVHVVPATSKLSVGHLQNRAGRKYKMSHYMSLRMSFNPMR